jgi:nucleotide-binding universal stress UspA family protein
VSPVVLAAVDDSATAPAVVAVATALAQVVGATAEAIHVAEVGHDAATPPSDPPVRVVIGDVVTELVRAADDPAVSALVVGARRHPRSPDGHPVGHVALALLPRLRTPLVVVPPDVAAPERLHRMLVPLDGTMATARRARAAIDLATAGGLEVTVIHVCDPDRLPMFGDQPQHETHAFAHAFLARYAPGAPVHLELRVGPPATEVLAAAEALDADLLALAWAQILDPGRARVVRHLLAHSPVPLLLLPLEAPTTASP